MITGYDPDTRTLTTGIGDLIGFMRYPETLVPPEHPLNIQKRRNIHNSFQRDMEKTGWQKEVPVELRLEAAGMTFHIRGRLDLLRETEGKLLLLEVKTVFGGHDIPTGTRRYDLHVLQLCFYAKALSHSHDIPVSSIESHLVYLDIGGESPDRNDIPVDVSSPEMEDAWEGLLLRTSRYLLDEDERKKEQIEALRTFLFPYSSMRPGQTEMMDDVRTGISRNGFLMIQAPTGTGKTAAILTGALRETLPRRLVLFFLTAKNTHKRMVHETLELIIGRGLPLRAVFLTAREKVCHRGRSSCLPDDCPYASDFGRKLRETQLIERLLALQIIEPEELVDFSLGTETCPFEVGLIISTLCDVVVCDYNYVFDPHVYLKRFFLERSSSSLCSLLIDEAANLPARARDYYSPELRLSWIKELLSAKDCPDSLVKLLEPWLHGFEEWDNLLSVSREQELELSVDTELILPVDRWMNQVILLRDPPQEFRDILRSILDFSRIRDMVDSRFHLLFRKENGDSIIQWLCTDPSEFLSNRLLSCHSTVAFSATLTPGQHFRYLLGFPDGPETEFREIPYPFPRENLGVWMDTCINTRYRDRRRYAGVLAGRLVEIHSAVPGTWLVFFPSYEYMELIVEVLDTDIPLLVQSRGMSTEDRNRFVSQIESGGHLVLTVSGGIFAEGIDLKSDELKGALVIGPSLPGMSLRQKLLSRSFEEKGKDGFIHTWAIPGMTRVIQAAGRLIRNEDQRRTLILVGERFAKYPYFKLLPDHWFRDGSIRILGRDLSDVVRHLE